MNPSNTILDSWQANADNWIQTIDNQEIESRKLVTNQAIVEAVVGLQPKMVLDLGCGEGWLTRTLTGHRMEVLGVDAIPALIENAQSKGIGRFQVASYQDIAQKNALAGQTFDVVVINFALIDKEETEFLIRYLPKILKLNGHLVIQTLHPLSIIGTMPYRSDWQPGSWNGMRRDFSQPYDWYFRTLGDWLRLFSSANLTLVEMTEPLHPQTQQPASMIFILKNSQ